MRHIVLLLLALSCIGCRTSKLRLGEAPTVAVRPTEQDSRWMTVVREVASMEGRIEGVEKVVITPASITVHLTRFEALTIARIARVVAAVESEAQITAPDPAAAAMAMTSGGYPAERISELLRGERVILQVKRATTPSARS